MNESLTARSSRSPIERGQKRGKIVSTKSAEETSPRPSDGPLFVVGVPRSGTSLLYALLNQHPQIALLYEGDLPTLWPLFLTRRSKSQWLQRWNFWNGSIDRHQIDTSRIPSDVSDIRTATEIAYKLYAEKKTAPIWGCKSPNQYDSLVRLVALFPNARFVMIRRDPADVCRSIIRASRDSAHFKQHRGLAHRALLGCYQLGMERDRLLQRGIPVHVIQYEDLVRTPTEELMKICEFLGIPFHSGMASLQNADRSAVMEGAHNALVRSESIVAPRKRPEVLPFQLKRKVERYKSFWRQKHVDWVTFPPSGESDRTKPSVLERVYDRLLYRLLRSWDLFVVFAYCLGPVRLLKAYRAWKGDPYLMQLAFARNGAGDVPEVATGPAQSSSAQAAPVAKQLRDENMRMGASAADPGCGGHRVSATGDYRF